MKKINKKKLWEEALWKSNFLESSLEELKQHVKNFNKSKNLHDKKLKKKRQKVFEGGYCAIKKKKLISCAIESLFSF